MKDCIYNMVLNKNTRQRECICKYNPSLGVPCEYLEHHCRWAVKGERTDSEKEKMMPIFRMNLDPEVFEDIFHELENISDGGESHYCDINAHSKEHAAEILVKRLHPFFTKKFHLHEM